MVKKIIAISVAILLGCYILSAAIYINCNKKEDTCQGVSISISNNEYNSITTEEIERLLKGKKLYPTDKAMNSIDCSQIETTLNNLSVIADCQCYKTHNATIDIRIKCKKPIMQIYANNGERYLIDENGDIIEGVHSALYLPVASGSINKSMARKELLTIAQFLKERRFWSEQIEQIHFTSKKEIIIVPRIGNHTIELGGLENIERKLDKLRAFYQKGLNNIGWNKYSKLNIEFDNKVIGTKR